MRRFVFLSVIWVACLSAALAQPGTEHRLAVLAASAHGLEFVRTVTLAELARLGHTEGQNLIVDMRTGSPTELPGLARSLVASSPNVIVALDGVPMAAVRAETTTIPVVMFGADPVELGFAQSLARPATNVTGLVILPVELDAKRVELLHEALPSRRRIAALIDVSAPGAEARQRQLNDVASKLGSSVSLFEASGPQAYKEAFEAMQAAGAEALAIGASPQFARDGVRLAQLALERRLPTICQWREMAEQGCLLSYGPSRPSLFKQTASFVARLLKGASPGEMPIEQPTTFELAVNTKTAKALSVDLAPNLLARADVVIE